MAANSTSPKPSAGTAIATRLPAKPSRQWSAWTSAVLGMDVDRLDLGPAAEPAQPLGEPVRGPALGVGPGQPALERAQLANDLHAPRGVHERGIIAAAADYRWR